MSYETDRIRERLNAYIGYAAVGAVRIVQRPVSPSGSGVADASAAGQPAALPAQVEDRLSGVDQSLRESLRALAREILAAS
jgi:hypothetical protein